MPQLVVLIDDDDANRAVIRDVLMDAGFAVRDYATSQEVDPRIATEHVALIVLDGGTPLPELHAPTVVVSAGIDVPSQATRVGARAWLRKPFDIDDLVELVRANAV